MIPDESFEAEDWCLRETRLSQDRLAQTESVFALGNGHIGVRGNLDEGEPHGLPGTYLNGFFERRPLPWEAAFLAGKCFQRYRRRGGARTSTLPDFYIGAHAAVSGLALLTRDAARYRTYFPRLEVISP